MKKKTYTRPVCVVLPQDMFQRLSEITEQQEISMSDYIRDAVQEKMMNKTTNK